MARDAGLQEAIDAAGSASALARLLGIAPAAVSQWKSVPLDRVPEVEKVTGVPRQRLRPTFWPEAAA